MPLVRPRAGRALLCAVLVGAFAVLGLASRAANAQIGPQTVELIDRLCSQSLRTNEEDRLYGMISLAVRATIRYRGGEFEPDIIDDAVQDSLDAMIEDCPELTEADPANRLTMAVEMISDATTKVLQDVRTALKTGDKDNPYANEDREKVTAADLSEELSSQEIDQWLDSLSPRERALSLFLYASDVTPEDIAAAVGEPPGALNRQFGSSKTDLMRIFRESWADVPPPAPRAGPAMTFQVAGQGFAALMRANPAPGAAPAAPAAPGGPLVPAAARLDGVMPSLRVTGISDDLYAGWSLLAVGQNLPRGQSVDIGEPFILEPDGSGIKRMLVVGVAEIGDPNAETRRFLLKAYSIDAENDAAGLRDTFHVGKPLDNDEARKTLANSSLSSIEIARCLWHDFGTGPDPGLCRRS